MSRDLLWVYLATPALLPVLRCAPGPSPEGRQLRTGGERDLGRKGRPFPIGLLPEAGGSAGKHFVKDYPHPGPG